MERTDTGRVDDPLIGRILDGRYQVGEKVARGGMATVYQARDLRLDRTVAVKVMHEGLGDDPEFVARFEREARSAARLSHHNVVAVFDQGEDRGTLFLVMEYVPGLTLRDLIRKEAPLSPGRALAVVEPVLAALAAAHGAGMIHRDMKPENVLLATDLDSGAGRVKVADFGLARAVNAETQHTATGGVLIGTVSYLSPELVVDGKADARSDVYAVGIMLYEMLTGEKPHQADSPIQVAYKHVHEDVPPPSQRVPGLPPYVDALVARATARDRDLRPSDARVLLHQVRRVRQALDHGIVDDPELTADLAPRALVPAADRTDELDLAPVRDEVYSPPEFLFDSDDLDMTTAVPVPPPVPVTRTAAAPPRRPIPPPALGEPGPVYRERRSRRGLVLLIGVLLAALLVGLGGWYLGVARYTTTPAVINLTQAAAKAKVEKAGLSFDTGRPAYSETVAKGSVIRTDPSPGDRVAKDGTVTATISLGPERHEVPTVRGRTPAEAQAMLDEASLTVGSTVPQYNETIPAGKVVGTDPRAGTPLKRDAAVNVIVSKGKRPVRIADWTGKRADNAQSHLEDAGFKVSRQTQFSDTVPKGRVISQSPNSGTGFKGDTITLVVSQGPELVTIPRLRGSRTNDAKKELEALGFQVKVEHSVLFVGAQYVVGVTPGEGQAVPKGSLVVLSVV
ncbi:Stk1 family PASTA domain-containing Ser/Thr kinase [Marmoricola sp. RAF53]|uniref:Stk1 family PASTA domain-containing Ser/Thr kinase n=1 Tax=Marmoricola sp. RAF53 TaxID=3233059 RepID=UPI003F9CE722